MDPRSYGPPSGMKRMNEFLRMGEKETKHTEYPVNLIGVRSKSSKKLQKEKGNKINTTCSEKSKGLPQEGKQQKTEQLLNHPSAFRKTKACVAEQMEPEVVNIKQVVDIKQQEAKDIDIKFTDVNGKVWDTFKVPINFKGKDLCEFIFQNVTEELEVKRMKLCVDYFELENQSKLSDFIQKEKGPKSCNIIQSRVGVLQVSKLRASHQECVISLESTSVQLEQCGHRIGSLALRDLIQTNLKLGHCSIYCPHKGDKGVSCPTQIDWDKCKRIGVLTKTEIQKLEEGLSLNYLEINMKKCPFCGGGISKEELESNRVGCVYPTCPKKQIDFCYLCLQQWKSDNFDRCGNGDCQYKTELLEKAPLKVFELKNKDGESSQYEVPSLRACPRCKMLVEHISGCKQMKCKACNDRRFCFVCLSLANQHDILPCGSFNHYCGKVAPIQKW